MRILFTACPMVGHVNTLLPLALAARRAGHTVVLATGVDQARRVEQAGLTAWSVGPTFAEAGWPPRSPMDFLAPADKRVVDLLPRAERFAPDVVVHEETEAAGAVVAVRTGARLIRHGLGIAAAGAPDAFATILDDLGERWQVSGLAERVGNATYLSICPPSLAVVEQPNTVLLRPALAPPAPGDASPALLTALARVPLVAQAPTNVPLVARAQAPTPTVHLTLGTVFSTPEALSTALAGLRELPVNVVVTTAGDPLPPQPANVVVARYLPHALLLPRCDLVVSQGGAGIMFGALAHGLPQLVLPQAADQPANAAAVQRAGAGLALTAVTADGVRDAARRLLAEPGFAVRAREIGAEIAAMPDADAVVSTL
jgi:UDP:flavonoid glycosyltransferase YjiC (YdhE family)